MLKKFGRKIAATINVLLVIQLMFFGTSSAYAFSSASQGPRTSSSAINDSSVGSFNWDNANFASISNNYWAIAQLGSSSGRTNYLKTTNYGFTVPTNATVTGVEVNIEKHQTCDDNSCSSNVVDDTVKLVKNGAVVGSNKASQNAWGNSDAISTYGSSADLWGTTLSANDVNANNFGVVLSAKRSGGGDRLVYVDSMTIKVYYTTNATPTTPVLVSPVNGTITNDNNVSFSWESSTDNDGDSLEYVLSVIGDNGSYSEMIATSPYTLGLADGTYTWKVRATDGSDFSAWTDENTVTVDTVDPEISIDSFSGDPTNQPVVVTARSTDGTFLDDEGVDTGENSFVHTFTENGCYTFRAIDNAGNDSEKEVCVPNIDFQNPELVSVAISSDNANDTTFAKPGDTVSVEIVASEDIETPVVTIAGQPATVTGAGKNFTATYVMTTSEIEGEVTFSISGIEDLAGNTISDVLAVTDSSKVVFDKTGPKVDAKIVPGVVNDAKKYTKIVLTSDEPITLVSSSASKGIVLTQGSVILALELTPEVSTDKKTITVLIPANQFAGGSPIKMQADVSDLAGNVTVMNETFTPDVVAPLAVTNFSATVNDTGNVVLTWTNPNNGSNYSYFKVLRDGVFYTTLPAGSTTFVDTNVEKGKTYSYEVVIIDAAGNETTVSPISVTTPAPVVAAVASDTQVVTTTPPADEKAVKSESKEETKNDEKKANELPIWGILILLILAGIGAYLYFSPEEKTKPIAQSIKVSPAKKKVAKKTTKK